MKTFKRALALATLVLLAWSTALAQNAYATQSNNDAESGGVNVTHSKEWYDQFKYNWPINTTTHESKITDKATDPDQIIALLRFIYMDKRIPGIYFAGYGSSNDNLDERVRPVYYGGIAGGWDIPYNASNDRYTDYETYKPNSEGYTVLLVAVKDNFTMEGRTADRFFDMDYAKLKEIISYSVEYVQLLTDGMRLNENLHGINGYFPGTLFTLENAAGLNRFFFLSKGQARDQIHNTYGDSDINGPFGRMFEQFSPTDGSEGSEITNYYEALKTGVSYPIQHDCNSVLLAEHYFSMVGKNATGADTHQDVSGLQFFIPDQRLTYFEKTENLYVITNEYTSGSRRYFDIQQQAVTYDGRTMNHDEGFFSYNDNYYCNGYQASIYSQFGGITLRTGRNPSQIQGLMHRPARAEYAYYHMDGFSPKTQWYRIELTATPVKEDNPDKWGEHTYRIDLQWHSSADNISYNPLDQIYWVYEIIDGEEVLISPEDGIINVHTYSVENYDKLYTEQYPSGRKRTFVVKGRPNIATYAPVRSNVAEAIIPGYDKRERLSLTIGTDYYSKWNAQGEYNQYCNSVKLENGTGNSVTTGYIQNGTEFDAYRSYIDEAGDEDTKQFAKLKFDEDWQTTNNSNGYLKIGTNVYKMRIHFEVTYSSQVGTLPSGKTQLTSGYLYAKSADDNEVFFGENGVELLDLFQASTRENKHPDGYTYVVSFTSSEEFEMDVLDENGNVQYVEDANGDFWYNPDTEKYEKIVEGESYDQRYKVLTEMVTAVRSNNEEIPVFKSTYSLHSEGYTQDQINNADNANDMNNLLVPHMTYSYPDGTVTTDLNKITVNLQIDATSAIHQYSIYRNPQGSGENNNKMIAWAQASSTGDNYLVTQNDEHNNPVEEGTKNAGEYTFEDNAILLLGAQSVAYVPVIETRPLDEERLRHGDYNTYGADIQHVGIPEMRIGEITHELSTYTWKGTDEKTYGYCSVEIPVAAILPAADKYTPYYWRSWRKLADNTIAGEEYQNFVRNLDGGFMYEQTLPDGKLNITSGTMTQDYTLTNLYGDTRELKDITSGTFGALRDGKNFNMDFKIRMYYLVNDVANRAPRRVSEVEPSATGQYYIVEYNIPYEFDTHIITGVEGVSTDCEVSGVMYYNAMGLPSTTPWSGVNIVVTRYTDGTTTTAKVVR